MGLSKNQLKLITSLSQKKYRQKHKLFVAEGIKVVKELVQSSLELEQVFITETVDFAIPSGKITYISEVELKKISQLKTPNIVLGLFKIPENTVQNTTELTLALDGINDPGNLGTIIRLCDWFGIKNLICSTNTVDCYNQKVVQSSMGSITRVNILYTDLLEFLSETSLPIFTADMNGDNVYKTALPKNAVLIMGNEANGISSEVRKRIKNQLTIPRFGELQQTESLNVATATAILLSEFRR